MAFESPDTFITLQMFLQLVLSISDHLVKLIAAASCFGIADRADDGVCGKIISSLTGRITAPGVTLIG